MTTQNSAQKQEPTASIATLLKVEMSADGMMAFVQKGSPIDASVLNWSQADLARHLQTLGFQGIPIAEDHKNFIAVARANPKGVPKDLVLLRGQAPKPMTPGRIDFINPPNIPRDQVIKGKVFLKITEAIPSVGGVNVKGAPTGPASKDKILPMLKKIPAEFRRLDSGDLEALQSGQAVVKGDELIFSPVYQIENAGVLLKAEFFSSVNVKGDLPPAVVWHIHGDLVVEGYWSAGNITVDGNVTAKSGVQTNMQGVIKVGGFFKSTYIQRTALEVGGDVTVESGALLSDITCRGVFSCKGSPGAVMGSKLNCFGPLLANKVGSDRGTHTEITIHRNPNGKKSKIDMLTAGTKLKVYDKRFIQSVDGPYESDS